MNAPFRCLVVAAQAETFEALSASLAGADFDVELAMARSGVEALALLGDTDVALIFLAMELPDMGGFALAERLRRDPRTSATPLLFVTADPAHWGRTFPGYESGAVDFVVQPLRAHVVRNKAKVFFQLYRQGQQLSEALAQRETTVPLPEILTAVLGHDLRNPLSAIFAAAAVLQRRSSDEGVQKATQLMLSSARRMNRMIDDLLDLARARLAGGIPMRTSAGNLAEVAQRVVDELRASFPDSPVQLRIEGDTCGEWDFDRLAQAISNLVANAQQHGRNQSPVNVEIDGRQSPRLRLSVTNQGVLTQELLPLLFEPFWRRRVGPVEGLGLGLYIVRAIAEAHGGRVGVETGEQTTTFVLELPRRAPTRSAPQHWPGAAPLGPPSSSSAA